MAYVVAGFVHYYAGRFDEAIAELEAAAAVVDDTGNLNFVLFAESMLARIAIRRGDLDAASAYLGAGITRLTSGGSLFGADWLLDAQTQYLAATGDHDAALNVAELTWSQTESLRFFYGYRERGIVAIRLAMAGGRRDFAEVVAESFEEGGRRCPTVSSEAIAGHARGLVDGDPDQLVDAAVQLGDTPLVLAFASCCEDAAAALATTDRNDDAIALLDKALAIHVTAGATADVERVEAARGHLGAKARRVRTARPAFGWESLTPTELVVSELVASGLTNPEIGSRLYVSRRTVESHLAHIFRKLDFVSRTQLASEFTRRTAP